MVKVVDLDVFHLEKPDGFGHRCGISTGRMLGLGFRSAAVDNDGAIISAVLSLATRARVEHWRSGGESGKTVHD
jgi:hypothetical protein